MVSRNLGSEMWISSGVMRSIGPGLVIRMRYMEGWVAWEEIGRWEGRDHIFYVILGYGI